ncbi:MAG TPA: AarF/UbiB family protein [Acidimicrobiia bacterium]|nr:AarF/UbiB family protein [Acidimicrobiia bacterium]
MAPFLDGLLSVLGNLVVLFAFAWVARGLLDARELTWRRLLVAALAGLALGDSFAVFLVVDDLSGLQNLDLSEISGIGLPFRIIATMGAIVVLEVLFSRPRRSRRRRSFRPIRSLRRAGGIVVRAAGVTRIATRHGLGPLLGLRRGDLPVHRPEELARRARMALEEAGGMFIKLGQLLATRPDLVPPRAQLELGKLHSSAAPLGREIIEGLIARELGVPWSEVFSEVEWEPLGSASIAQAHAARLLDGSPVVVKVRRPGLTEVVARDLAITRWLARTAVRRTSWGASLDAEALAAEFGETLEDELDLRIEARSLREVAEAAASQPLVHVPRVHAEFSTEGLLVMERLDGTPLSKLVDLPPDRTLADVLTKSQVGAMMNGERFHGDPHPGNLLLLDDGRLGLIDLGISGRLDAFERAAVFQMLMALRLEQPTLLYESMMSIGAVDPAVHDPDEIERAFAAFMAAHLGHGLPPPEALTDLMRLTTELGLRLPRSTMAMFRALATLTGTVEHLSPGYPVIEVIAELGGDEFQRRLMPESAADFIQQEWAQLAPLVSRLPRHIDRLATILEHGRLVTRMRLFSEAEDRHFVQRMLNLGVLALLSIGTGLVSVMLLGVEDDRVLGLLGDVGPYEILAWTGLFIAITLLLRVLLSVLRSEADARRRRTRDTTSGTW